MCFCVPVRVHSKVLIQMFFTWFQLWSLRKFSWWPVEETTPSLAPVSDTNIILIIFHAFILKHLIFILQLKEKCTPLGGTVRVSWGWVTVRRGHRFSTSTSLIHMGQSKCWLLGPTRQLLLLVRFISVLTWLRNKYFCYSHFILYTDFFYCS